MTTERPEDIANREYYNHRMLTRRVRAVIEADVEWREDDPGYTAAVVESGDLLPGANVRVLNPTTVSYEIVGGPTRLGGTAGNTDPSEGLYGQLSRSCAPPRAKEVTRTRHRDR